MKTQANTTEASRTYGGRVPTEQATAANSAMPATATTAAIATSRAWFESPAFEALGF